MKKEDSMLLTGVMLEVQRMTEVGGVTETMDWWSEVERCLVDGMLVVVV